MNFELPFKLPATCHHCYTEPLGLHFPQDLSLSCHEGPSRNIETHFATSYRTGPVVLLSLRLPFVLNLNYFKSCLGETVVTSLRNIMQLFWLNTTDNLRSQVKRTQHCCCNMTCSLPNDQINVALKFDRSKKICDIVQYRTTLGNKRGRTVLHYANTTKSHDMNCCNGSTRGRLYKTLNHFSITVFNHFSITVFNHFLITVFNHFLITVLLLNSD